VILDIRRGPHVISNILSNKHHLCFIPRGSLVRLWTDALAVMTLYSRCVCHKDSPKNVLNGKLRYTKPVGKPRTRWEDVVRRAISHIIGVRGWRRLAEDIE